MNIVTQFRQRFASEQGNASPDDTPPPAAPARKAAHPVPATDAAFHALESLPQYWSGRAMGRRQATEAMDLTRDHLADHQAIAEFEQKAELRAKERVA